MQRQYAHLTSQKQDAIQHGTKYQDAVLVKVNTQVAIECGGADFYACANNVWLSSPIIVEAIKIEEVL